MNYLMFVICKKIVTVQLCVYTNLFLTDYFKMINFENLKTKN